MSSSNRAREVRRTVLLTLATCTAWLVVQNTALFILWLSRSDARPLAIAAQVLGKAAVRAGGQLWPVAGVLLATLGVAAVGALLLAGVPRAREVRHG